MNWTRNVKKWNKFISTCATKVPFYPTTCKSSYAKCAKRHANDSTLQLPSRDTHTFGSLRTLVVSLSVVVVLLLLDKPVYVFPFPFFLSSLLLYISSSFPSFASCVLFSHTHIGLSFILSSSILLEIFMKMNGNGFERNGWCAVRRNWTYLVYEKLISLYELVANILLRLLLCKDISFVVSNFFLSVSPSFSHSNREMPRRTHECSIRLVCAPARRRRRESK